MTSFLILAVNLNPNASTRQGIQHITRIFRKRFGARVVERHFLRVEPDLLQRVDAVILGPQGTPFDAYGPDLMHLFEVVTETRNTPTLGICGGCQAMVLAEGGDIGPLQGGPVTGSYDGRKKHVGWREVYSIRDNALLPIGNRATVKVSHVEATTRLPACYQTVASSDYCAVQMIKHRNAPRWGVQFHPEQGRDGYAIIERFIGQLTKS